jgi:hypothetical protein
LDKNSFSILLDGAYAGVYEAAANEYWGAFAALRDRVAMKTIRIKDENSKNFSNYAFENQFIRSRWF